ncbi:MAG: transcriptional regulator, LuxR family, partial [Thermoleophilia bacterium]|nr:transcriptional regulator, LuxR family [Thermoleophilia bacterium]
SVDEFIIGRERELAQLDLFLGAGTDGLRLSMLTGPSGQGKKTIAGAAATAASDRGYRVATINGRAGTLSTPFSPFIEAMPEFDVLLSVLAGDTSIDLEHVGIGLVNLLAELSVEQPILLVFDDAQALDESSIALLPYIAGVSDRMDITMMFVEQTDAIGIPSSYRAFVDGMLSRRIVDHLQLQPLADTSIRELVAHTIDIDVSAVPEELVTRATGNPWFAKELAEAWRRGIKEIPTNIAAAATSRLHHLDDMGQDIVNATALCLDGAYIGWLEALSEQKPRQFVRTMETIFRSGLIREDGDIVTIAHPLMQQALVGELSAAMARAIHLELAEVAASVPLSEVIEARAQGYHLAAAGRPDEAVSHYLRAAAANEAAGQLHEAYVDYVQASSSAPRNERRMDILRNQAFIAQQLGQYDDASAAWTEIARAAATTGDDDTYAYALYQQYWTCNDGQSFERLQRVAALGPDRIGWSARAAGAICRMDGDFAAALDHDSNALKLARSSGDKSLEALAILSVASSQADLGRLADSIRGYREAIELAVRERLHAWVIKAWGSLAETLADDLQTTAAVAACLDALRYVDDLGLERDRPAILAWLARSYLRVGKLQLAFETIVKAVELDGQYRSDLHSALIRLIYADVTNEMGDRSTAEPAVAEALQTAHHSGFESWIIEAQFGQARLHGASGRISQGLDVAESLDTSEPTFVANLAAWGARLAAQTGDTRARQFTAGLLQRLVAEPTLPPAAALGVEEAHATLALLDSPDPADLLSIADRWDASERPLDALRARASVAYRIAAADKEGAISILRAARVGFAACGAALDADHVASRLRELGTRSRASSRTTQVGPLTKRELEIARLVASGLKNSEVASTLFLAEKTVAAHLSNIYGKVEVRSRVQLTGWIREHDTEFVASLANAG